MTLRIAPGFALADDFVTKTCGVLAQRRKGKTYTASVIAEEMVSAGIPFVALDPTSAWWGLRASADGKSEGLPVTILGGQHGDVPLERGDGKAIAELVVDVPGHYVIDFGLFESGAAEKQFATEFAQRLYRRKGQPDSDFAMHLFIDEADRFVPQRITDRKEGDAVMLGAFEAIVRRGGLRGLGTTLISQRSAVVNKNVLEQLDVLIVLRVVGPNDQKAIRDIVTAHGSDEQMKSLMSSLASLDVGEAWVWEPGEDVFERVQVRQRTTFNSSATPKAGERRVEPKRLAPVDLEAIKDRLSANIEKARADDPRELRKRIGELERQLARAAVQPTPEPEVVVERVEVPVLDEGLVLRLEEALSPATGLLAEVQERLSWETTQRDGLIVMERRLADDRRQDVPRAGRAGDGARAVEAPRPTQRPDPPERRQPRRAPVSGTAEGDVKLGKGERTVLAVLAQWPQGRTYNELAFLAGYSAKASTLGVILAKLRRAELVSPGGVDAITLTDAGLDAAGGATPLPNGPALLDHWRRHPRMGEGERRVVDVLVDAYPDALDHRDLCERAGYSPDASTIGVILSRLRKLGLVEKKARRLAAEFAEAIV